MEGSHVENWENRHATWIQVWNERQSHCLTGHPDRGVYVVT